MGRIVASLFQKKDDINNKSKVIFDFNKKKIRRNLKNNKKANAKFIEALVLYFAYRDLTLSKVYFEKDENMDLSGILWDNAELFVVAHEYSHIILGHLSPNQAFSRRFLHTDSMLYEVIMSWNEEFSADELALKIVFAHSQNDRKGVFAGYLGIELLFVCFDIIEKVCNVMSSETHPLANLRIHNLRKCLKNILPEQHETFFDGSEIIEEIGLYLLNTNKETVYDLLHKLLRNSYTSNNSTSVHID
ncbi:MAG TPA: hypothetical protein DEF34_02260 [Desulfotomaculum sp.]|nr:MAG: hypothetical protein JL56_03355 [Desulfotomaculum sp. BICA1-6]HBX22450.1 hypothetical protein [Desulfotomaculum sp.]